MTTKTAYLTRGIMYLGYKRSMQEQIKSSCASTYPGQFFLCADGFEMSEVTLTNHVE